MSIELMITTDRVRKLSNERQGTWAIKKHRHRRGHAYSSAKMDAKVLAGRTTVEEVVPPPKLTISGR